MEATLQNNHVSVRGKIGEPLTYQYEIGRGYYYSTVVEVSRLSSCVDRIPVAIPEQLMDATRCRRGKFVDIRGQFRSRNRHVGLEHHLQLYVQVKSIRFPEESLTLPENQILLNGYICKPPLYRKTPLQREITDVLLAVNRPYGESDYIPCIFWRMKARFAFSLEVGSHILINGRIQSREYRKKLVDERIITRTAYEVSVNNLRCIEPSHENGYGSLVLPVNSHF